MALTSSQEEFVRRIAESGVVVSSDLDQFINNLPGGKDYASPIYSVTIDTGTITIPRLGNIMFVKVNTEGDVNSDTFDEIIAPDVKDGDLIFIQQQFASRIVSVFHNASTGVYLQTASFSIKEAGYGILLKYDAMKNPGGWVEVIRYPFSLQMPVENLIMESESLTIETGAVTASKSFMQLQSERAGEVRATIAIQVTAAGLNPTIDIYVDEGAGTYLLASESWAGVPLITTIITDIETAINATGTYTAVDNGVDTVTISAPVGTGATPNASWIAQESMTGGLTLTTNSQTFAGGVNGADANDTLETIYNLQEGQVFFLYNMMSGNKISCDPGPGFFSFPNIIELMPGDLAMFKIIGGQAIIIGGCCKKLYKATLWVDPLGVSAVALRGSFHYPFPLIKSAVLASSIYDEINISATGNAVYYDERDLLYLSYLSYNFAVNATIKYSGAGVGGIFDDSATGANGPLNDVYLNFGKFGGHDLAGSGVYIENNGSSGGGDVGVFKITDAVSLIFVNGGRFVGKNYTVKMIDGILEISNAQIWSGLGPAIVVSGGTLRLKNCVIIGQSAPAITRAGGSIILEDCFIKTAWNNAAGHGIDDTAAATTGKIVFIGTNRIICTHAAALSISITNAQNYKNMGLLYSNRINTGPIPQITDMITGAALAPVVDADVE